MSLQDKPREKTKKFSGQIRSLNVAEAKTLLQEKTFDLSAVSVECSHTNKQKQEIASQIRMLRTVIKQKEIGHYRPYRMGDFLRYRLIQVVNSKVYPDAPLNAIWVLMNHRQNVAKKFYFCLKGSLDFVSHMVQRFGDKVWREDRSVLCTSDVHLMILALQGGLELVRYHALFLPCRRYTDPVHTFFQDTYLVRSIHELPLEGYPERIEFKKRFRAKPGSKTTVHPVDKPVQDPDGVKAG